MSTGYGWEGVRQVCATLLGARHVPERLCGGSVYLGRYNKCSTFTFTFQPVKLAVTLALTLEVKFDAYLRTPRRPRHHIGL